MNSSMGNPEGERKQTPFARDVVREIRLRENLRSEGIPGFESHEERVNRLRDFLDRLDEPRFASNRVPRTDFGFRQIRIAEHERRELDSRHRERLDFSPVFAGIKDAVGEEKKKLRGFRAGCERLKRPEKALTHRSGSL